jgi:chromosome segregation ATPase
LQVSERLQELEGILERFSLLYEELRRENAQLKASTKELLEELEGLRQENEAKTRQLKESRRIRAEIGRRIDRIREHLSVLERPI